MLNLSDVLDDWPLWGLTTKPVTVEQVKRLSGGLTNQCFQLSLESGEYIIRISAENTQALGINRHVEKSIHQLVSSLQFTSSLRYCSDDDGYWIRDFISGEVVSETLQDASAISDSLLTYMVEQLKALHQVPIDLSLAEVNISQTAESYWDVIESKNPEDELLKMKPLMQVAMSEPPAGELCLCHLDPVLANWLYTAEGLQLLDWEYAGFAHPLWDLAAFFQDIKDNSKAGTKVITNLENKILSIYGVQDLVAWRRAKVQMEYLSSLWHRAQS